MTDKGLQLQVKRLSKDAVVPTKAHDSDAGFDLYSPQDILSQKGKKITIPLGIASSFSAGYFGSFRDRSGLAFRQGLHVLAGVLDADYRGEWTLILVNLGDEDYQIKKGDRVAQVVMHKIPDVKVKEVKELKESTSRGSGGLGSTGK